MFSVYYCLAVLHLFRGETETEPFRGGGNNVSVAIYWRTSFALLVRSHLNFRETFVRFLLLWRGRFFCFIHDIMGSIIL